MALGKCCWQLAIVLVGISTMLASTCHAREVVAFWGFANDYEFASNPNKQDFVADADGTITGDANLQAYLGVADELDINGGGGFVSYTSPTSGITYEPTRTLKFDDLKGGGDDFDIDGLTTFSVDKMDGAGPEDDDFGNDALVYITLNGTNFADYELRFDIEGEPDDLPSSFDIFYRTDGPGGTWWRESDQNNIPLTFFDYDPVDPENQYADSGVIALSSQLDLASNVEIIISDFAEFGNGEMELDNIEITATVVPEPTTVEMVSFALLVLGLCRRSNRGGASGFCSE